MGVGVTGHIALALSRAYTRVEEMALHREAYSKRAVDPQLYSFPISEEELRVLPTLPPQERDERIKEIGYASIDNLTRTNEPIPLSTEQRRTKILKDKLPISEEDFALGLEQAKKDYVAIGMPPEITEELLEPLPYRRQVFPDLDRPENSRMAVWRVEFFSTQSCPVIRGTLRRRVATAVGTALCLGAVALTSYVALRHR